MLVSLTLACEKAPEVANPKAFEGDALRFEYPGNWTIEDQTSEDMAGIAIETLTVNSPGDAIAVLTMTNPSGAMTLAGFAEEAITVREEEIKRIMGKAEGLAKLSKTRVSEIAPVSDSAVGQRIRHDFAISMVGEEVAHWGDFHHFAGDTWDVFVYTQAPHEDWKTIEPGFDQILKSIAPR